MKHIQRKVILYGDSLILEGIHTNLRCCPDLEMVSLVPPLPKAKVLHQLSPDVIIFDLEANNLEALLELLQTNPQLLLIGIDLMTNQMLLWSGEHSHALSLPNLVKVIQDLPGAKTIHARPAVDRGRGWSRVAALFHSLQGLSRQQKLVWSALGLATCAILVISLTLTHSVTGLSLAGAVVGQSQATGYILAFTAGIAIGCLALMLWLRGRR